MRYFCVHVYKWSDFIKFETNRAHTNICCLFSVKMEELFLLLLKVSLSITVWISFPVKGFGPTISPSPLWIIHFSLPPDHSHQHTHILLYLPHPVSPHCYYPPPIFTVAISSSLHPIAGGLLFLQYTVATVCKVTQACFHAAIGHGY